MMKARLFSLVRAAMLAAAFSLFAVQVSTAVPTAKVAINGTVFDSSDSPISGVTVIATALIGTNYQTVTTNTSGSGSYSLLVASNTTWSVGVSSDSLDYLSNIGSACYNSVVDNITVKIGAANGIANFIVPNCGSGSELDGYLVDQNNNPIAGVGISASTSGYATQNTVTDANGFYEFVLEIGAYDVELNCTNLTSLGFQCVSGQTNVGIGFDYTYQTNFLAQPIGQPAFGPFFTGQSPPLGSGWFYLGTVGSDPDAFGYYNLLNYPFINHLDLGWEYYIDAGNANHGAYFYDFADEAWFYTEPALFPYLYDFKSNTWMYFAPQNGAIDRYQSNPRWFYNTSTDKWVNNL